jgi:hypothetical protein
MEAGMRLLSHESFNCDLVASRLFKIGLEATPWKVSDLLTGEPFVDDPSLSALAWRLSSRGYYTEQAGLVAAAELAAETEDADLRFGLALAVADEARHADAFLSYARLVGGEPDDCGRSVDPLSDVLGSLPYLGKALVHTVLEGFAADQFLLLEKVFHEDPLGAIYHHVRLDEIRHVAVGLSYLARESRTSSGRDEWREHADEWLSAALELAAISNLSDGFGKLLKTDKIVHERWFIRRHWTRLKAAGIVKGGEPWTSRRRR